MIHLDREGERPTMVEIDSLAIVAGATPDVAIDVVRLQLCDTDIACSVLEREIFHGSCHFCRRSIGPDDEYEVGGIATRSFLARPPIVMCGDCAGAIQEQLSKLTRDGWSDFMDRVVPGVPGEMVPEGCRDCAALENCRAGCRAMALETGLGYDPLMKNPSTSPVLEEVSLAG